MALSYNLSKVYAFSDDDPEFVNQMVNLFVTEVPDDILLIKEGIKSLNYEQTYMYAHKIKPSLDLFGLHVAFQETLEIEAWAKSNGQKKSVIETFKSVEQQVKSAIKELKKDFSILHP